MKRKKLFSTIAAALLLVPLSLAQAAINPASVQKLAAADGRPFGSSMSLSADGGTALIDGADRDDPENPVYVFVKGADGRWSQQAKLIVKDEITAGRKPGRVMSVTLSADGRTAFIGHSYLLSFDQIATYQFGSVWVFVKGADGRWSQKAKLTDDNSENGDFGDCVSLSADGSTALISAGWASTVFVRDADGRWSKQAKIPDVNGYVSLSANGGTALIGTSVFVRGAAGRWSQQAEIPYVGGLMLLSGDGGTALIGDNGIGRNSGVGAAYIFVRGADGTWSQKAKLAAADGAARDLFSSSVSLSADGRMALIGAPYKDDNSGAAYIFAKGADGSWSQQVKLTAPDGAVKNRFGSSVSLSADGNTGLVGTWDSGAAYVYGSTAAPQPARKP
jgi:hypothetical protein